MKKIILMAALMAGTAFVSSASAATGSFGTYFLTYGSLGNPTPYGTVVVENLGGGVARITENVTPNFILDTGNHLPLAFNLAGQGTIDICSVTGLFAIDSTPPFSNQPFGKDWQNAISGTCGNGASDDGCGSVLSFLVNNFSGLSSSDVTINGVTTAIFFATDIINVATGASGAVGAGMLETPIPPALALFLSGLVGIGMLRRVSKRKVVTVALDEAAVS